MDGIYALGCLGAHGFIMATWVFVSGKIYGFDSRACLYDGTYRLGDTDVHCFIQLTIPPGILAPFEKIAVAQAREINFELALSGDWDSGRPFLARLNSESMQISAVKVRSCL